MVAASVHVPVPDLVKADVPDVAGLPKIGVKVPFAEPVRVKVGEVAAVVPNVPELPKVNAPVPDESIVAPFAPTVNKRSVVTAAPVYLSVPPLMTKFVAALLDAPILLLDPPLASVPTDKVPAEIVLVPE